MLSDNPYQPPVDELPQHLKSELEAADLQARLKKTSPVPDVEFWLVVAVVTAILFLALATLSQLAILLIFAWLGGCIRVCMVYSARARAALPPVNAILCQITSSAVCFTLQTMVLVAGYFLATRMQWQPGWWMIATFLSSVLLYILLFLWSVRLAKYS